VCGHEVDIFVSVMISNLLRIKTAPVTEESYSLNILR
jgi:hypothetical protein